MSRLQSRSRSTNEKTYVFPGMKTSSLSALYVSIAVMYGTSPSFTVKEAGRFYDTFRQNIMSVTFTSAST